jgi:hypothetical protein
MDFGTVERSLSCSSNQVRQLKACESKRALLAKIVSERFSLFQENVLPERRYHAKTLDRCYEDGELAKLKTWLAGKEVTIPTNLAFHCRDPGIAILPLLNGPPLLAGHVFWNCVHHFLYALQGSDRGETTVVVLSASMY